LWRKACQAAGESIDMYSGLKHSSCCQYLNDKGLSLSELQIITDHANMESVKRYGKIEIDRKRQLLETRKTGPDRKIAVNFIIISNCYSRWDGFDSHALPPFFLRAFLGVPHP
jgi:hypothetical protein